MPRFYVLSGPDLGKTADVGEGASFGRSSESAVTLRGGSISRNHAQLEKHGDVWVLVDLGSRNGISKDGARSERIELADGDVVMLGDVELRFRAEVEAPSVPRAVVRPQPAPAPAPSLPTTRDDIELEEISLDDDIGSVEIDFDPYAAPAPAPPRAQGPPKAGSREVPKEAPKPSAPEPSAKSRVAERAAAAGIALGAGARQAGGGVEVHDAGRPVIQFHKVPNQRGFLVADLAQYPLWVKLAAGLLVAAVFVAIFVFAFRGASLLTGGKASADVEDAALD